MLLGETENLNQKIDLIENLFWNLFMRYTMTVAYTSVLSCWAGIYEN